MRAGSLRSAPLAGLVSAHHAVHAGPCSVIGVASAWRKKLQTHKCGSAYPNCATCSRGCCGADGTALSTCCIGPSGEDAINSELCAATIESADRLCPHSIYNCSIRLVRRVRATGNVIHEERLLGCGGVQVAHVLDCFIGHVRCEVVVFLADPGIDRGRIFEQVGRPLVALPTQEAIKVLEAHADGPLIERPSGSAVCEARSVVVFAEPCRSVAVFLQDLADGGALRSDHGVIPREASS